MSHNELAEQSASYAQEILRLQAVNAEMLADLGSIANLAESGSMSLGSLIKCGTIARAAIAKAKGE